MATAEPRDSRPDVLFRRWRETGDPAALAGLFDLVAGDLFRVAVSLCGDGAAAEDAVQETFLVAIREARGFEPARRVMPWLLGILGHKAADARRQARRSPDQMRLDPPLAPPDPATEAERREAVEAVRAALDRLPDPYRAVALLRWEYGLEPGDIARVMGHPPGTVRSLLSRARERLERALRKASLLAILGARAPRGLDAVRSEVLREAAGIAIPASAGAGGAAAALAGGVLMAKKAALAVAAILLVGIAAWWGTASLVPSGSDHPHGALPVSSSGAPAARPTPAEPGAPETAPTTPGARLSLQVLDSAGKPVAGARAAIEPRPHPDDRNPWRQRLVAKAPAGPPSTSASSGPDGAATLEPIAPGDWRLRVDAYGFAAHEEDLHVGRAGEELARTVVLLPSFLLEGTVIGDDGSPVPGAEVLTDDCRALSDPSGRYRLEGLSPGTHSISVRSGGAMFQELAEVSIPGPRRLDLRLEGGALLEGRVLDDATGVPVSAASVFLLSTLVSPYPRHVNVTREVATDASGAFRMDDVPPSTPAYLEVRAEGYLRSMPGYASIFPTQYRFALGDSLRVEVRLRRGTIVSGCVVRTNGTPVAGAIVEVLQARPAEASDIATDATTGPDGRYSLRAVPGQGLVRVRASGLSQRDSPGDPWAALRAGNVPETCRVEVAAGGETTYDVTLEDERQAPAGTAVLAGTVRREDGAPLVGAYVRDRLPDRTERLVPVLADGGFRFEGLPAGKHALEARAEGCPPARLTVEALAEGEERTGLDLVLAPGWDLEGTVADEAGLPVPGATVTTVARSRRFDDGAPVAAVTGAEGRFAVRGLPREDAIVSVRSAGFVPSSRTVAAGEPSVSVTLERALSISGTVVEEGSGSPVAGILVWANETLPREGALRIRESITDATGRFRVDGLDRVDYDVCTGRIADPGPTGEFAPSKTPRVKPGTADVRIELRRGLAIAGRVVGPGGRPAPGGTVDVNGPDGGPPHWQRGGIGPDGSFRIPGLPPGTYVLQAAPGGGLAPVRLTGIAAGTTGLEVRAAAALTIRGRLLLEDGSTLPTGVGGFQLRWRNADGSSTSTGISMWGADGSFETPPLDPLLVYDIVFWGRPGFLGGAARRVRPGTRDLVVTIAKGGIIEGRVVDEDGKPVGEGHSVAGMAQGLGSGWPPEPGQSVHARTASDGTFRLDGLADLPYDVYASGDDLISTERANVRPGTNDVVVRVRRAVVLTGTVLDADGKPLRAGFVQIERHGQLGSLDGEGRFRVFTEEPGERHVFLQQGSGRILDLGAVSVPAKDVVLTVPRE